MTDLVGKVAEAICAHGSPEFMGPDRQMALRDEARAAIGVVLDHLEARLESWPIEPTGELAGLLVDVREELALASPEKPVGGPCTPKRLQETWQD